jgi:hypothetical protein
MEEEEEEEEEKKVEGRKIKGTS